MANKKISQFPLITTLQSNDIFLIDHLGTTSTTCLSTVSNTIVNTVTGSTWASDTFIHKPVSPAPNNNDVLYYNGGTSTWESTALSSVLTQTNVVKSTSITKNATGTSVEFTGIPSTAKKIILTHAGVSTNGTSNLIFRIGTSSQIYNIGYVSAMRGQDTVDIDSGFALARTESANRLHSGVCNVIKHGLSNIWISSGVDLRQTTFGIVEALYYTSGIITLPSVLTRLVITTINGTDTFDSGTIVLTYEE